MEGHRGSLWYGQLPSLTSPRSCGEAQHFASFLDGPQPLWERTGSLGLKGTTKQVANLAGNFVVKVQGVCPSGSGWLETFMKGVTQCWRGRC